MTRAIFLDIDGVLNSNLWNDTHQYEISDGTLIDSEKIKLFDSDLKPLRTESERLRTLLLQEGLMIDSVTPDHATEEIKRNFFDLPIPNIL